MSHELSLRQTLFSQTRVLIRCNKVRLGGRWRANCTADGELDQGGTARMERHRRRRSIDTAIAGDQEARDVERSRPTRVISLDRIRDVPPATLRGSRRLCLCSNGAFGSALRPPHDAAHRGAIARRGMARTGRRGRDSMKDRSGPGCDHPRRRTLNLHSLERRLSWNPGMSWLSTACRGTMAR